jgi:plasmid stabilization system protein ParE
MDEHFQIVILPEASSNILEVWTYIHTDSPQNAALVLGRFFKAIDSLEHFPRRCRVHRSTRDPSRVVRAMSVSSFIVYYRIRESDRIIEILTIRRSAQRQPRRFA